ncbi:hypothetical protein TNCV_1935101 [Trichonephila clavipes]|nr:hypothetical protein TNCV_1935101 [Trichonephila clavipes]
MVTDYIRNRYFKKSYKVNEAQWLSRSASRFHTTGLRSKTRAGPGRLNLSSLQWTATAGSDVVQSGRPVFDDFFQHFWPYTGNNTANVVFQMVKRLWLIRIDQ